MNERVSQINYNSGGDYARKRNIVIIQSRKNGHISHYRHCVRFSIVLPRYLLPDICHQYINILCESVNHSIIVGILVCLCNVNQETPLSA